MGKRLVAYFSASGVTRRAAEMLAEAAGVEEYDVIFARFPIWLAYHNLIQCTQA